MYFGSFLKPAANGGVNQSSRSGKAEALHLYTPFRLERDNIG